MRMVVVACYCVLAVSGCGGSNRQVGGSSAERSEARNTTHGPVRDELDVAPEILGEMGWIRDGKGLRLGEAAQLFASRYHLGPQVARVPIVQQAVMLLESIHEAWGKLGMEHRSASADELRFSNPRQASFLCTIGKSGARQAFACVWALPKTKWLMTVEFYATGVSDEAAFVARSNKEIEAVQRAVGAWESAPTL